ncbi:MAG TPA: lysophospholipase [Pseudogracilibacillus sp.]|nr:lysophospholipase [Pseudogracilibacillus sp.]
MNITSFTYETKDRFQIAAYKWMNEEKPKAIIQIAHGMAEHAKRYDHFAHFLLSKGFHVYANDHRGHGDTIHLPDERGFYAPEKGFEKVVSDMEQLNDIIHEENPGVPVFLLGHSMGSFLSRRYAQLYGKTIAGLILSGTGYDKGLLGKAGIALAKIEMKRIGMRTPSPLLDKMVFGNFNKPFAPARTKFDFLTRSEHEVDLYIDDPNCGFICTAGFFHDLFKGIELIHKRKEVARTPYALPIFIFSGSEDPVGDHGDGVMKVYDLYNKYCEYVSVKLYHDGRHEMLNEINREEVYDDIVNWIHSHMI